MPPTHERRPADGRDPTRRAPAPIHGATEDPGVDLDGLREALGNAAMSRLLDPRTSEAIDSQLGQGAPMHATTANDGEVRLHDDGTAADLSRRLGAVAFTFGRDIFLAADAPDLDSPAGSRLLSHELTHVRQQRASGVTHPRRVSAPGSSAEREAARVAGAGGSAPAPAGAQTVHRQADLEEDEEVMTMTSETIHRQVAVEEEDRAETANETPDATTGPQAADEGAKGPTTSAAWDPAVESNLATAIAAMQQQPPDARTAHDSVDDAASRVDAIVAALRTDSADDRVMWSVLSMLSDRLSMVRLAIGPYAGINVPLGRINAFLANMFENAQRYGSQMGGGAGGAATTTAAPTTTATPTGTETAVEIPAVETAAGSTGTPTTAPGDAGAGPIDAAPTEGAPATAAPAEKSAEATQATFQETVLDKIQAVEFNLRGDSPDPRAAHVALGEAGRALKVLGAAYETSDPVLAETIRATRNQLIAVREILGPFAGVERTMEGDFLPLLPDLRTRLQELLGRLR